MSSPKEAEDEQDVKMSGDEHSEDSDLDDDDDDDDEMVDDEKTREKLVEIDEKIRQNPFDYQAHVDKISVLKASGELDGLRQARENFAELYPLAPTIWLDWISDERTLATSDEEKEKVCQLFERAVKDYVSVEVWLEYCQFFIGTAEGMTKAKDVFERGIASVGVHVSKGTLLWEAYREFENALLSMQPDNVELQEKVDKIFRRQLAVPLQDMENTFDEYSEWVSTTLSAKSVDPNVERQYKNALSMLKKREKFETELATCEEGETKSLEIYDRYLAFEMKDGNPARIQCLFERRVTDHCLHPKVWIEYVDYLDRQLKMGSVSLPVYERSVRNCTWSSDLWIKYMRATERYLSDKAVILKLSEQALSAGFADPTDYRKIWLAYIDYLRRRLGEDEDNKEQFAKNREEIRLLFGRALEHVAPLGGDPDCILARYWASLEADRFRSMEEARKIWTDVMVVLGDKARFWTEQIQLEKSFGDTKHIRRVFQRALDRVRDVPETICEAWLQFEREEGTLEQFEDAEAKIKIRMEKVYLERERLGETEQEELKKREEKIEKKKVRDLEKRREKRRAESDVKKRKIDDVIVTPKTEDGGNGEPCFKKPLLVKNDMPPPPPGFKGTAPPPGFKGDVAPPPGFKGAVAPPPGFKGVAPAADAGAAVPPHDDVEKQIRTVFLSNLDFSVEEEPIKQAMSTTGTVVEVRLIRNPVGKSKGFAFVEFSTEREARSAVARDREMFQGRPLFISECDPEKKTKGGHQFQFGTGLEKNKLFVKDLSKDTSRDQLHELFAQFGPLKEVRLITYRNGHSKGLAFVEYEDEVSAAKALIKTDGTTVDGHAISVAISNPPAKKVEPSASARSDVRSLGGGAKDVGARGRGRTQVSFVPRALAVKAAPSAAAANGSEKSKPESSGESLAGKSNQDFRNMLLGKK